MDKVKFELFEEICKTNINKGIYCLGAQGQDLDTLNFDFFDRRESNHKNRDRAYALWLKRKDKYPKAKAFDCSGLLMYYLQNICGVSKDRTADGIYKNLCTPIGMGDLRKGDMVFKGSAAKKSHIGYVIDDAGTIVSAKGRDAGVVDNETGWKYAARFGYWIFDEPEPAPTKGYPVSRSLKKGCKGADVKATQEALLSLGYDLGKYGADGSFGSTTQRVVKIYQGANGLTADGVAGKKTITFLSLTGKVYWAK